MPDALKPSLYTVPEFGTPQLRGGRCACGHIFFPMQAYGCERCGQAGDALTPMLLAGRGRLVASARVQMHARKDREVPFTVLSVALDDGPVVRTLLGAGSEAPLVAGQPMFATLEEVPQADGGAQLDLRFSAHP
ncbi:Zn-ribbon domain-containing OB-fold protein [Cupriavidus sp. NPDC089707]|uniref:Zn-ribbon domain-containing OB-fold protein n=1 Tax=Cupriavidus sp. NPDC089707 TaxID=3363963 RepID=UPI0038087815